MKRIINFIFITFFVMSSCSKFDDSKIWDKLNDHENRIIKLEILCDQMNTNVSSLRMLIESLQKNEFVTTVMPVTDNGREVGYVIAFSSGKSITIYHGKDGKDGASGNDGQDGDDGYTPIIGVKKDADGVYYWTLDGEWLKDENGNKLRVTGRDGTPGQDGADGKDGLPGQNGEDGVDGEDGKDGLPGQDGEDGVDGEDGKDGLPGQDGADGKDGVTPLLKIEDNYWYVSYDNGVSWNRLGKAVGNDGQDGAPGKDGADGKDGEDGQDGTPGKDGQDGDSFFQSVTVEDTRVVIVLKDGTTIDLPIMSDTLSVTFEDYNGLAILAGESKTLGFIVAGAKGEISAECVCDNAWSAEVSVNGGRGTMTVTAPESGCDGKVILFVNDAAGRIVMKSLKFTGKEKAMLTISTNTFNLESAGGYIEIPVLTNIQYKLQIPSDVEWVRYSQTKATREETLVLFVEPNVETSIRETIVHLVDLDGNEMQAITISQEGFEDQNAIIYYTTSDGCIADVSLSGSYGANMVSHEYVDGQGVIKFDGPVVEIPSEAFRGTKLTSVIIPSTVREIDQMAFAETNLKDVILPETCNVDSYAFIATGIDSISLPEYGTIGQNAFAFADITELTVPAGVELDYKAFESCKSLKKVHYASNTNCGEKNVFYGCYALEQFVVEAGHKLYDSRDNCNALIETSTNKLLFGCAGTVIPTSVTGIGMYAFAGTGITSLCINENLREIEAGAFSDSKLTTVEFSSKMKTIPASMFQYCTQLETVTIPDNVTTIEPWAFYGCSSLHSVVIGKGVSVIGNNAFGNCSNLSAIKIYARSAPHIGGVFSQVASGGVLIRPKGSDYSEWMKNESDYELGTQGWTTAEFDDIEDSGVLISDISANGTANCYVIQNPGTYKFRAVKGNTTESFTSPYRAEVIWETDNTANAPAIGSIIASASYANGYVTISTPSELRDGNAVIVLKNSAGTVLWSWHIWCTYEGFAAEMYKNGNLLMDRNLGALSKEPENDLSNGLLYQWGRKDPFLGKANSSGEMVSTNSYLWDSVETSSETGNVDYVVKNPTTFVYGIYNDWLSVDENTLWASKKTVYDPCPVGYRVPDGGPDGFWNTSGIYAAGGWEEVNGLTFKNVLWCPEIDVWYPAAGTRYYGDGEYLGGYGEYWSVTYYKTGYAYSLYIDNSGSCNGASMSTKATGLSVRCCKE